MVSSNCLRRWWDFLILHDSEEDYRDRISSPRSTHRMKVPDGITASMFVIMNTSSSPRPVMEIYMSVTTGLISNIYSSQRLELPISKPLDSIRLWI